MDNLKKLAESILRHRKIVLIVFAIVGALCIVAMNLVNINFNMSDYLPDDAPSTVALQTMEENFDESLPNLSIYILNISIPEALGFKDAIAQSPGVESVLWLDDVVDTYTPLETLDQDMVEAWYKDSGALFSVSVDTDNVEEHIDALKELVGDRGVMAGNAYNLALAQNTTSQEIPKIVLFLLPLVILILLLSTDSWFEPVLFLLTIGMAILINEGTNIILGQVSFVTRSSSAVLQLAVSMDYAVFLLHRFARFRREGLDTPKAMSKAMAVSFSSIAASAMTTVIGFLVLVLMRFQIGPDMGVVLAKGIVISFLCVMVLLPVLSTVFVKLLDRTSHRHLLPSFEKFGKFVMRICIPLSLVVLALIVPAFLGQKNNHFIYGSSGMYAAESQAAKDMNAINAVFGQSVQMVLLVPQGDIVREAQLSEALEGMDHVTSVISYTNMVGVQIPEGFLSEDDLSQFRGGEYCRLIVYVSTSDEGTQAFSVVEQVRNVAQAYYPDVYHLVGQSVVNYDLKATIVSDNRVVTIAVIVAIALVLLLTFRSFSIPIILLLVIEGATWINLSIPYFTGSTLNYLGYQIISSVQLGATVDYGILFMHQYMVNRKSMAKRLAVQQTITDTAASILTPASILTIAGLMLGFVSSNGIISQLGLVLGRGGALSALMVLLMLPGLLLLLDGIVQRTTRTTSQKEIRS